MLINMFSNRLKILSGSMLKLMAILFMLIDHTALVLHADLAFLGMSLFSIGETEITIYYVLRKLGRLAFPIFCFLVTEGFSHTRNLKKYILSLLLFAVLSEIPFNIMMSEKPFYPARQNIYFTLFLGILLIYFYQHKASEIVKAVFMLVIVALTIVLRADYGLKGALLILLMYALRNHAAAQAVLSYPLLSGGYAAWAAFIPINMYNGQRGFIKSGVLKYSFYVFYPLHIIILIIIKTILK